MATTIKKSDVKDSFILNNYFCKLSIKGVDISPINIQVLNVRESIFQIIPNLELVFTDHGIFTEKFYLNEGDEIKVTISKNDKKTPPIDMIFSLNDFSITNLDSSNIQATLIRITAFINSDSLFAPIKTRCFKNYNSEKVMSEISSECKFKFNSKIKPSDNMNWYQVNQNNFSMISETLNRSFKPNDAIICFVDRYNNFNMTSLFTETANKNFKKMSFDPKKVYAQEFENKNNEMFFSDYQTHSITGTINKELGFGIAFAEYDGNGQVDKKIIDDKHSLTQLSNKNPKMIGKIVRNDTYSGTTLTKVYPEYHLALQQNEYYMRTFFNNYISLDINPNEEIKIMDKIRLNFPSNNGQDKVNNVFSGDYLVGVILHQVAKEGTYRQKILLFRDGYNKPSEEK